ncbi:hypothetical protein F3J12_02340 [Burkholderia sp. Ax-1735]|nr:hypothetical protein [Burkholderia sp. Ap-955]NIF08417.1 hypothetical protein [Burkholderia sp. Ax-1735]NIG01071.1 hypothetical protein [Burkholderia sp. Tr-849]
MKFGARSGDGAPLRDAPFGVRCTGRLGQPAARGDRVRLLRHVCVDGEFERIVVDADLPRDENLPWFDPHRKRFTCVCQDQHVRPIRSDAT